METEISARVIEALETEVMEEQIIILNTPADMTAEKGKEDMMEREERKEECLMETSGANSEVIGEDSNVLQKMPERREQRSQYES